MRGVNQLPELYGYEQRIKNIPMRPLQITVRVDTPVASNDPVALDGILAWAVVAEAFAGRPFPQGGGPYWQPLPLGLEKKIDGLPLWQSTDFIPENLHKRMTHIHRRTSDNPYAMPALIETVDQERPRRFPISHAGPYMDYRVPERRYIAERWIAYCVGNQVELERLLSTIQYFGKGSKRGCGFVGEWIVEQCESFSFRDGNGNALRPIPFEWDTGVGVRCGWSPPYWLKETWRICEPSIVTRMM